MTKQVIRKFQTDDLFNEIEESLSRIWTEFKRANPMINTLRLPVQHLEILQQLIFNTEQFVNTYYKRHNILLLDYSVYNFPMVLDQLLWTAQKILKNNAAPIKEFKIDVSLLLYVVYDLTWRCCSSMPKEILDSENSDRNSFNSSILNCKTINKYLIQQSMIIFHPDFPKELCFLKNHFSLIISILGSRYSFIYSIYFDYLTNLIESNQVPTIPLIQKYSAEVSSTQKLLSYLLNSLIQLPGDSDGIKVFVQFLNKLFQHFSPKSTNKLNFCKLFNEIIRDSVLLSFKNHFYLNSSNANLYFGSITNEHNKDDDDLLMLSRKNASLLNKDFPVCNTKDIQYLSLILDGWNEKSAKPTWPTQMALLFLLSEKVDLITYFRLENLPLQQLLIFPYSTQPTNTKSNDTVYSLMQSFPNIQKSQMEIVIFNILILFKIFSISCGNETCGEFIKIYFNNFLEYFFNKGSKVSSIISNSEFYTKCYFVDFPITALFLDKSEFRKILSIIKERNDGPLYIAKIIRRLCRQGSALPSDDLFDELIDTVIWLFNKAESDAPLGQSKTKEMDCKQLLNMMINCFIYYPKFLRKVICVENTSDQTTNVNTILTSARKHSDLPWQEPLLLFFESFTDTNYFPVVDLLLKFLFDMFNEATLTTYNSQLGQAIPLVIQTAAMSPVFQQSFLNMEVQDTDDENSDSKSSIIDNKQLLSSLKTIIKTFEMSAILLISSANKEYRDYGVKILNNLIDFVVTNNLNKKLSTRIPIDNYHSIVHEVGTKNLPRGHDAYKGPLRTISPSTASDGYKSVWLNLYNYFVTLTLKMNPQFKSLFDDKKQKKRQKDNSFLSPFSLDSNLPVDSNTGNINPENEAVIDSKTISEWIGCASILFAISAQDDDGFYNLIERIFIMIYENQNEFGSIVIATFIGSLNSCQCCHCLTKLMELINKMVSQNGIGANNSTMSILFNENLMVMFGGFMKQEIYWTEDIVAKEIELFQSIVNYFVNYCDQIHNMHLRNNCAQFMVNILTLIQKNNGSLEPIMRNKLAKTLLNWISTTSFKQYETTNETVDNDPTNPETNNLSSKELISCVFSALALLLDNLSLIDCYDQTDTSHSASEQAIALYNDYFDAIKPLLDSKDESMIKETVPYISGLLKQNLVFGLPCLNGYARASLISSLAIAFTSSSEDDEMNSRKLLRRINNISLIDIIFASGGGLDLIEYLSNQVPYSCADSFGKALVEAAYSKNLHFKLLERMIDIELRSVDPASKNSLFRGNAVPACVVGYFPRLVASNWMKSTLRPLFEEVIENCKLGVCYIVDPNVIKSNCPENLANDEKASKEWLDNQLQTNQKNLKDLLIKSANTISDAFTSMPPGIITEAQLIYRKVYERYGDFASQILGGFLFLRFLLPPFTLTSLVGLPPVIDNAPRKTLVETCKILNSAVNKGTVDDKPEYQYLAETAETVLYPTLNGFFKKILKADTKNKTDDIEINTEKALNTFHSVLYPLLRLFNKTLKNNDELVPESEATTSVHRKTSIHQSMGLASSSSTNLISSSITQSLMSTSPLLQSSNPQLFPDSKPEDEVQNDHQNDDDDFYVTAKQALVMLIKKLKILGEPKKGDIKPPKPAPPPPPSKKGKQMKKVKNPEPSVVSNERLIRMKNINDVSLQWSMLNFAFLNMIDQDITCQELLPVIHNACFDLVYAVFHSFEFKHNYNMQKVPSSSIPSYLLNYVVMLSKDIADNNPDAYIDFIHEFFEQMSEVTLFYNDIAFNYLKPWMVTWINNINQNPEFTSTVLDNLVKSKYQRLLATVLIESKESLECLIRAILTKNDLSLRNSIVNFSAKNEKDVTLFLVDAILTEIIEQSIDDVSEREKGTKLLNVIEVINSLLNSNTFYLTANEVNECIVCLVKNLARIRLIYSGDTLENITSFFGNVLGYLQKNCQQSIYLDVPKVCRSFCLTEGLVQIADCYSEENFEENTEDIGRKRIRNRPSNLESTEVNFLEKKQTWLSHTYNIASAIDESLKDSPNTRNKIFWYYMETMDDLTIKINQSNKPTEIAELANAIVFAGSLCESHVDDFISKAISIVVKNKRKDFSTLTAFSFSLSKLKFNEDENEEKKKKMSSKLFYLGVMITLYLRTGPALELIATSIHNFYSKQSQTVEQNEIDNDDVDDDEDDDEDHVNNETTIDEKLLKYFQSINNYVSPSVVQKLVDETGLPFNKNPVFSALACLSLYSLKSPTQLSNSISKIVDSEAIHEPFAKVLSLFVTDQYFKEVCKYNFGENFGTVISSCLFLLKLAESRIEKLQFENNYAQSKTLLDYVLRIFNKYPNIFYSLKIHNDLTTCLLHLIHNPHLRFMLIFILNNNSENSSLAKSIMQKRHSKRRKEKEELSSENMTIPSLVAALLYPLEDSSKTKIGMENVRTSIMLDEGEKKYFNQLQRIKRMLRVINCHDFDSFLTGILNQ